MSDGTKAQKKLMKELENMQKMLGSAEADTNGIGALPTDDSNLFAWKAVIQGPPESEFEGAWFPLTFQFSPNYPHKPPSVKFDCDMHHPNVYTTRNICVDILSNTWSPAMQITTVLSSLRSLLVDPNINSPANCDASKDYREDRKRYAAAVRESIIKQALQHPPAWYTTARSQLSAAVSAAAASSSSSSTSTSSVPSSQKK